MTCGLSLRIHCAGVRTLLPAASVLVYKVNFPTASKNSQLVGIGVLCSDGADVCLDTEPLVELGSLLELIDQQYLHALLIHSVSGCHIQDQEIRVWVV